MTVPAVGADWKPVPVGWDGAAVGLLSLVVAVGTGGGSLALALAAVVRAAWRAPTAVGACGVAAVLGHRLDWHGQPTPAFRRRLRRGRAVAEAHGAALHVLGGVTRAPFASEGEVGRDWLLRAGMAGEPVVAEGRSRHTLENLRALRASLPPGAGPVVLVTCRAHAARAGAMARAMGLPAVACAAERRFAWRAELLREAGLLHWHQTGYWLARVGRIGWLARRIG